MIFFIRTLRSIVEWLAWVVQTAIPRTVRWVLTPIRWVFWRLAWPLLLFWYERIVIYSKRWKLFFHAQHRLLSVVTHRWVLHASFVLIGLIVVVSNISQANGATTSPADFARGSLLDAVSNQRHSITEVAEPIVIPVLLQGTLLPTATDALPFASTTTDTPGVPQPFFITDGVTLVNHGTVDTTTPHTTTNGASTTNPSGHIWPTSFIYISSPFGYRWGGFHTGLDMAGRIGDPVWASASGTVTVASWNNGGYGNMILIDHGHGVQTRYGHLSQLDVTAGQTVTQGQQIGLEGSTGNSTGPHLHYECIINDTTVNPIGTCLK